MGDLLGLGSCHDKNEYISCKHVRLVTRPHLARNVGCLDMNVTAYQYLQLTGF